MRRLSLLAAASSALLAGRASGQSSCVDDTSYADPEGYTCSDWAPSAYVCSESAYSDDDLQALLDGCPLSCDTCTPAVNTQDDCADDSIFADEQGYPCNDWADASLVCSAATSEHSYSSDGEAALLAACPVSCETCVSADNTDDPGPPPPPPPPPPTRCEDDDSFADPEGFSCYDWSPEAYVCSASGYSEADQQALLDACGASCGSCTAAANTEFVCEDDSIFRDEQGYPCNDWADASLDCSAATSEHGYESENEAELLAACPVSCGQCAEPAPTECTDDDSYTDPAGHRCAEWILAEYSCTSSGYSDDEQLTLLAACPLSCGSCTAAVATEEVCTDDSVFHDEMGYPCFDWSD